MLGIALAGDEPDNSPAYNPQSAGSIFILIPLLLLIPTRMYLIPMKLIRYSVAILIKTAKELSYQILIGVMA